MAIWQFHIYLIPQKSLLKKYGQVPLHLKMDKAGWSDYFQNADLNKEPDFEDAFTISWWLDLDITFDNMLPILYSFGEILSWTQNSQGLKRFGNAETNDISVCFDDTTNIIEEISCRIDLRQPDKCFIGNVLSLAKRFDCLLMDKKGRLYQPTLEALFDTIKLSNAYRFVSNPELFLTDFSKGNIAPE